MVNPIYRFFFREYQNTGNKLNPRLVTRGADLAYGEIESGAFNVSDFMAISGGIPAYFVTIDGTVTQIGSLHRCALYDANKTWISDYTGVSPILPSGTAYVRIAFNYNIDPVDACFRQSSPDFVPYGYVNTRQVFPLWSDKLAKDYKKENNQVFFRASLSAKLTFLGPDYAYIMARPFDYQFQMAVQISYDNGAKWSDYFRGCFWKTDCEFDMDAETVLVNPTPWDDYTAILDGMSKEYDIITLAPEIVPVKLDKRPMIQVYCAGSSSIGCFLSGMWWEQDANAESDYDTLRNDYKFAFCKTYFQARILTGPMAGATAIEEYQNYETYISNYDPLPLFVGTYNGVTFNIGYSQSLTPIGWYCIYNGKTYRPVGSVGLQERPFGTMQMSNTIDSSDIIEVDITAIDIYMRIVCDVNNILGTPTYDIPTDDIVANNRNYHKCIGYRALNTIVISEDFSSTPTEWGLYQPGQYYLEPYILGNPDLFPISRESWGAFSVWFVPSYFDVAYEQNARAPIILKNAYPLGGVISVLLAQVAPEIKFEPTAEYSEFLFGTNPITGIEQMLLLSPKSNLITANYDQPAQKAPATLQDIFDMLRDCFRCYWFIDDKGRLRIEHILFFLRGEDYHTMPGIGHDLTAEIYTRNKKSAAQGQSQYSYNKPDMPARYQFKWMDDVSKPFEGWPIDILSKYVQLGRVDDITLTKFTSDVDYIMLNPDNISKDGFVLMSAEKSGDDYVLPYLNYSIGALMVTQYQMQNGYVSFYYLQRYYAYDMPAWDYKIDGTQYRAQGVKRTKVQRVKFPVLTDPDLLKLIKTFVGVGSYQKLSITLSSREADATIEFEP